MVGCVPSHAAYFSS
jgi:solute carrier family 25 (mitochondrial iron transporter), member 28/37